MKLHADRPQEHSISSYGPGWITINGTRHTGSLLLSSRLGLLPWNPVSFAQLDAGVLESAINLGGDVCPELLILGSGDQHRLLHPRHSAGLAGRRVGVETMDTGAACRTFNILAGEGRHVMALLLVDPTPSNT